MPLVLLILSEEENGSDDGEHGRKLEETYLKLKALIDPGVLDSIFAE
jgi:hypothetical protein